MEEINLKDVLLEGRKQIKYLIVISIIGIIVGLVYGLVNYFKFPKETSSIILIDKNSKSIASLVEDNGKESHVEAKFDSTNLIINLKTSGNKDEELNNRLDEYETSLNKELVDHFEIQKFDRIERKNINKFTIGNIILSCIIGVIISTIIFVIIILVKISFSTTTDEYEISEATGIKVLGNAADNKENILKLILTNIDVKETNKILIFLSADKKTNDSDLIEGLSKIYSDNKEKVVIISNKNINDKKVINIKDDAKISDIKDEISKLSNKYDRILIDGESLDKDYRTTIMTKLADRSIIVARSEKTSINDILKTKKLIEDIDNNISGLILI